MTIPDRPVGILRCGKRPRAHLYHLSASMGHSDLFSQRTGGPRPDRRLLSIRLLSRRRSAALQIRIRTRILLPPPLGERRLCEGRQDRQDAEEAGWRHGGGGGAGSGSWAGDRVLVGSTAATRPRRPLLRCRGPRARAPGQARTFNPPPSLFILPPLHARWSLLQTRRYGMPGEILVPVVTWGDANSGAGKPILVKG